MKLLCLFLLTFSATVYSNGFLVEGTSFHFERPSNYAGAIQFKFKYFRDVDYGSRYCHKGEYNYHFWDSKNSLNRIIGGIGCPQGYVFTLLNGCRSKNKSLRCAWFKEANKNKTIKYKKKAELIFETYTPGIDVEEYELSIGHYHCLRVKAKNLAAQARKIQYKSCLKVIIK